MSGSQMLSMSKNIVSSLIRRHLLLSVSRTRGNNSLAKQTGNLAALSTGPYCRNHGPKQVVNKPPGPVNLHDFNVSRECHVFGFGHSRFSSNSSTNVSPECQDVGYIHAKDNEVLSVLCQDMTVIEDFVSEEEEQEILKEIEPYLKRLKYQSSHWDDAIHEYRETERRKWTEKNTAIIQRVRDIAFPPGVPQIAFVHVLDLKKEGQIKPHVDAVKFCGNTIAGISLLSSSVMRLVHTEDKTKAADILLKQRSLYIMKNEARYKYTHEILPEAESYFRGTLIPRERRISVICRNEPET